MAEEQARGHPHQKGLPAELWKVIFHEATRFSYKDEFTIDPFARFSFSCTSQKFPIHLRYYEIGFILKTRLRIVLVCKTWYTLGIADLYSHVYFNPTSPMSKSLHRVFMKQVSLLSHVRRLTLRAPIIRYSKWFERRAQRKHMKMAIALISSLPRLRLVDIPPEIALILPIKRFPPHVEAVAIVNWRDEYGEPYIPNPIRSISAIALKSVQILLLDVAVLHRGMPDTQVNFQSVTRFTLSKGRYSKVYHKEDWETVGHVLDHWAFPSLQEVRTKQGDWPTLSKFLRRHSSTLRSLFLDGISMVLVGVSVGTLVLPKLQEITIQAYGCPFPYLNIDSIALKSIDFQCVSITEEVLLPTFDLFCTYQNLKSCRVYGLFKTLMEPANYPHVMGQLATLRKRGVTVENHVSYICWRGVCEQGCRPLDV
ncbi:hypothetical protein M408DRAFT_145712 [Serendipita vermifera MAFF 305830]|uniref:F-box domain-containing protein n=1 Tax=Serendipita vermifera MAFF 305830 TaxID=933852 RepID=A0A0C2WRN3_SERVB|nr:hypothetical protein M408DRAFT_145712 [Serendipita vermifera MAFF 305830]